MGIAPHIPGFHRNLNFAGHISHSQDELIYTMTFLRSPKVGLDFTIKS